MSNNKELLSQAIAAINAVHGLQPDDLTELTTALNGNVTQLQQTIAIWRHETYYSPKISAKVIAILQQQVNTLTNTK